MLILNRCVVWGNCANAGDQVSITTGDTVAFVCSDVDSSGVGGVGLVFFDGNTIFSDPLFCGAASCTVAPDTSGVYDYTLDDDSPCLASASLCGLLIGAHGQGCTGRVLEVGGGGPFVKIQDAIDEAVSGVGDTVLVADSTWTGDRNTALDFGGKDLVLKSVGGAASAVINGGDSVRAIVFTSGESSAAVVDGFTFSHGDSSAPGSAVYIDSMSSPTIRNCIISANTGTAGAVRVEDGSPTFEFCTVEMNTSFSPDGVVSLAGGVPTLKNCIVQTNTATNAVRVATRATIVNSSVIDNSGNGIYLATAAPSTLTGTTISTNLGTGLVVEANSSILTNCTISSNDSSGILFVGCSGTPSLTAGSVGAVTAGAAATACPDFKTTTTFNGCTISGNTNTTSSGAGIRFDCSFSPTKDYTPRWINCTITGNSTGVTGGAAYVCGNAVFADIVPVFSNCTITANNASGEGGGIYMAVTAAGGEGFVTFERTILWGNCSGASGSDVYADADNTTYIGCSVFDEAGAAGGGSLVPTEENIDGDPLFCSPVACASEGTTDGDFQIATNSAAVPDSSPCGALIGANPWCATGTGIADTRPVLPEHSNLWPNVPNPFNPSTTIRFDVAEAGPVTLRIYDAKGRLIRTLVDDRLARAQHRVEWDGRNDKGIAVATGVYFARLTAGAQATTRKLVLLK